MLCAVICAVIRYVLKKMKLVATTRSCEEGHKDLRMVNEDNQAREEKHQKFFQNIFVLNQHPSL